MVKQTLTLLLFSLALFSCYKDNDKLVIQGELSNLMTPYIIASSRVSDTIRVDTIFADVNGRFSYTQNVDTATMFTFYFNDFTSSTIIFSEKGVKKIQIKGDATLSDLIEVKGGEINENLSAFKKENETLLKQRSLLLSRKEYDLDNSINSASIISEKDQSALINSLNHELAQKVEEFILSNPDKLSSVILINDFFKNNENPETLNRVLEYLEGDALKCPLTMKLKSHNKKLMLSAEGSQMPYFKLKDNKDKILESSDFGDKYLLISFLSSNGDSSEENIRILRDEYDSLKSKNIEFLSIYIDSDTLPIINRKVDSIPWKMVVDNKSWGSDMVDTYNVHYLPFNILIDKDGKIVSRDIPVSDVRNMVVFKFNFHRLAYFSAVKDIATGEIVGCNISQHLQMNIVLDTLKNLKVNVCSLENILMLIWINNLQLVI